MAAEPGWENSLAAFVPALRACLAGDLTGFIDDVGPAANARLAVRVRRGVVTERCLVSATGQVAMRLKLPDAPPPEPAATAYFLERRCVDARRLAAPDGTVLGWLAYPAC